MIFLTLVSWGNSASSEEDDYERLYGLTIDSIEFVSPGGTPPEDLAELAGLKIGNALDASEMRRAVKLFYQLGRYENVYVFGRRLGNVVQLKIKLIPRRYLKEFQVFGANTLSSGDIETILGLDIGRALDPEELRGARTALKQAYFERGYRSAAMGFAVQKLDQKGASRLILRIDEGPVTRLRKIRISGDLQIPKWKIRDLIGLETGDVARLEDIRVGIDRLRAYFHSREYLNAEIGQPNLDTSIDPMGEWGDLDLVVRAGPIVRIEFRGNVSVPIDELQEATQEISRGGESTEALLSDTVDTLFQLYERRGHWRARIRPRILLSRDGRTKTIVFFIEEGTKGRVTRIAFPGNTALDENLLREKVYQVVGEYLSRGGEESMPDTQIVDRIIGSGSRTATIAQLGPYPVEPNARTVYVARAYRASADALELLFRASGYQTVEIGRPEVVTENNGTDITVAFPVKEGVQWKIGALSFVGNQQISTSKLFELAGIEPGEDLSFYRIDAASRTLARHYKNRGYFYARVDEKLREIRPRGQLLSRSRRRPSANLREVCDQRKEQGHKDCEIELVLSINEGPLVNTKRIVVRGNTSTRRALIDEEISLKEGGLLRVNELEQTQRNLSRLGVFQRVTVQAIGEDFLSSKKDVLVELKERKHSSFEVGAGVSTEEGLRTFVNYGHGNLLGTALRFQTNAKVNAQVFFGLFNDSVAQFIQQDPIEFQVAMGIQYPRILGFPRGIGLGMDAIVLRDNDPAFRAQSGQVVLTSDYKDLGQALGLKRRSIALQLQFSYDQSSVACNEGLINLGLCGAQATEVQRRVTQQTDYLGILPRLSIDLRDNALEPRFGAYFELLPQFLWGLNTDSLNHLNLKSKLNAYVPLGPKLTLATSFLFWRIFRLSDTDGDAQCLSQLASSDLNSPQISNEVFCIPVNRRFFAGGRSTIRGFLEQTLFPADQLGGAEEVSPGGMLMVAAKTELRFPVGKGVAGTVFFDIGDLYADPNSFALDVLSQNSFGFGLRYSTPIGPLLLDAAFRIEDGEPTFVPHFAAVGSF